MELADEPVSTQVNRAVSESIALRRQQRLLQEMLDAFDAELGAVDEATVQKLEDIILTKARDLRRKAVTG